MEATVNDPILAKYGQYFNDEQIFQITFGGPDHGVHVTVTVTPDENEEEDPQVVVEFHSEIEPRARNEFVSLIESMVDYKYYEYNFDFDEFMRAMYDWLYYRTGDPIFKVDAPEKKKVDEKRAKKPLSAVERRQIAQKKAQMIEARKQERNSNKIAQRVARMVDGNPAQLAYVADQNQVNRIYYRYFRQREEAEREEQIERNIKRAQGTIYRNYGREAKYAGEETKFYLENMELAYEENWDHFKHCYSNVTGIPRIVGLLTNLVELNLSMNKIKELPQELFMLTLLRKLNLSWNQISNIQLQVGKLQSLILLDVEHNQLVSVPEELSQCTQLEYLEFAHNKIRFFPESIILKCERIRYLGFNNNLFAHIPPSIGYLKLLECLMLKCNPMKMIPAHVYHQGLKAVTALLRDYAPDVSMLPGSNFAEEFRTLLFSKTFSDCTISIGHEKFFVHLALIEARAPGLHKIIAKAGSNSNAIALYADRSPAKQYEDLMRTVLTFIYTDEPGWPQRIGDAAILTPEEGSYLEILEAEAVRFGLQRLACMCQERRYLSTPIPESQFVSDLKSIYNSTTHSDLTFRIENELITAHRCIVAARSKYLHAMFTSGLKEAHEATVDIMDLSFETFKRVLEFIYVDDTEPTSETAIDLLIASAIYELPRLASLLQSIVGYSLDPDNAACILEIAVLYECKKLERACLYYIASNYRKVRTSEAWAEMSPEYKEMVTATAQEWRIDIAMAKERPLRKLVILDPLL